MPYSLSNVAALMLPSLGIGRALSDRELHTLACVAEVFLQGAPVRLDRRRAAENVERFLVTGRSRRAWRVRVLLTAIELSTVPTDRSRFSELSLAKRTEIVRERWEGGHHVYRVFGKVRNLAMLGIYGDARAAAATGYVPVPLRPRFKDRAPIMERSN